MLLFMIVMDVVGIRMFMEDADVTQQTLYQVTKGSECVVK